MASPSELAAVTSNWSACAVANESKQAADARSCAIAYRAWVSCRMMSPQTYLVFIGRAPAHRWCRRCADRDPIILSSFADITLCRGPAPLLFALFIFTVG